MKILAQEACTYASYYYCLVVFNMKIYPVVYRVQILYLLPSLLDPNKIENF